MPFSFKILASWDSRQLSEPLVLFLFFKFFVVVVVIRFSAHSKFTHNKIHSFRV